MLRSIKGRGSAERDKTVVLVRFMEVAAQGIPTGLPERFLRAAAA